MKCQDIAEKMLKIFSRHFLVPH